MSRFDIGANAAALMGGFNQGLSLRAQAEAERARAAQEQMTLAEMAARASEREIDNARQNDYLGLAKSRAEAIREEAARNRALADAERQKREAEDASLNDIMRTKVENEFYASLGESDPAAMRGGDAGFVPGVQGLLPQLPGDIPGAGIDGPSDQGGEWAGVPFAPETPKRIAGKLNPEDASFLRLIKTAKGREAFTELYKGAVDRTKRAQMMNRLRSLEYIYSSTSQNPNMFGDPMDRELMKTLIASRDLEGALALDQEIKAKAERNAAIQALPPEMQPLAANMGPTQLQQLSKELAMSQRAATQAAAIREQGAAAFDRIKSGISKAENTYGRDLAAARAASLVNQDDGSVTGASPRARIEVENDPEVVATKYELQAAKAALDVDPGNESLMQDVARLGGELSAAARRAAGLPARAPSIDDAVPLGGKSVDEVAAAAHKVNPKDVTDAQRRGVEAVRKAIAALKARGVENPTKEQVQTLAEKMFKGK